MASTRHPSPSRYRDRRVQGVFRPTHRGEGFDKKNNRKCVEGKLQKLLSSSPPEKVG